MFNNNTVVNNAQFHNALQKYGSAVLIDIQSLLNNLTIIKSYLSLDTLISCVIKNNAYGLNLKNIIPILQQNGYHNYSVANFNEAMTAFQLNPKSKIYVLHGITQELLPQMLEYNPHIVPVLNTVEQIEQLNNYAKSLNQTFNCCIHIETGLNRFGITKDHIIKICQSHTQYLSHLIIEYIISHFACADIAQHFSIDIQYNQFMELTRYFPQALKSLSASYSIFLDQKYHFDLVRPGISIYGGNPMPYQPNQMHNVVYAYSTIQQIKDLKTGEYAGYSYTWQAQQNSKIAIIPYGYGDGLLTANNGIGYVYIANHKVPIIKVSMDSTIINITHLPQQLQKINQPVEIIGDNLTLDHYSKLLHNAASENLNSLTTRYPRLYI